VAVEGGALPIEELQVGQRVTTLGETNTSPTAVDETWSLVRLELRDPSAPNEVIQVDTLRSEEWLRAVGALEGGWIDFALPEMGIEGDAVVVSIDDAPKVQDGLGRVVLSTVSSISTAVVELSFEGTDETLLPTDRHRFFSLYWDDWIRAGDLQPGELLVTRHGPLQVREIRPVPGGHRVYNIEVETEHSYLVGDLGVLSAFVYHLPIRNAA
jgi:hypothetical protein